MLNKCINRVTTPMDKSIAQHPMHLVFFMTKQSFFGTEALSYAIKHDK